MFGQEIRLPSILRQNKRKRVERLPESSPPQTLNTTLLPQPPLKRTCNESHEQCKQTEIKSILREEHTEGEPAKTKPKKQVRWIQEDKAPISQFFTIPALQQPPGKKILIMQKA